MKIFIVVYLLVGVVLWLKDMLVLSKGWKISITAFILSIFEYIFWPIHYIFNYLITHNKIFQNPIEKEALKKAMKKVEKLVEKWEEEP